MENNQTTEVSLESSTSRKERLHSLEKKVDAYHHMLAQDLNILDRHAADFSKIFALGNACLLYTSDAADE